MTAGQDGRPDVSGIAGSPSEPGDGTTYASDAGPLRQPSVPRPYDHDGVRRAVRDLLLAVGEDPDRDGLAGTPDRVARSFAEIFAGMSEDPADHLDAVFDIGHEEMVLARDIPLYSMCEHHLLPFHGVAHVGYIPAENGRVTGLSKLARLVEGYARRPQVQERLTSQIADALVARLQPRGVIVIVEAEHLCMSMRGVRKPGSRTVTSAVRGTMRRAATRAEAMSLLTGRV
ncbi:GTP cyclohydrolase I FolE [Georgenia alba]|uniref:GTP cyclohydrolase 1 n=1 Tax=Georgenia alba TaxID=2233858 RepID=A0ABW2QHB3_9MICO